MNYYFLSYDRHNDEVDSEQLRRSLITTFLEAGCILDSNEETAIFINTSQSIEEIASLLTGYNDHMFYTLIVTQEKGYIYKNIEHQENFKSLVDEIYNKI
ncbi:hypothetical protein CLV51_1011728 [Chitinophaga niastensis]|uniref:Uncharacterized protein n=1 Tax=Chitinophaga niastensis TaxID=536980 RepID=A0A2P8HVX7_CHINA|nr:hypothetical protein [Chitinophaga niastensis]PSL50383.1 hypothetical protein CLV51_1011728 [Chitinophaga niastensis]